MGEKLLFQIFFYSEMQQISYGVVWNTVWIGEGNELIATRKLNNNILTLQCFIDCFSEMV